MDKKCDICHKRNATIHLQQIMGNREVNLHICNTCAMEHGISRDKDKIEVSLTGLFAGLVDIEGEYQRKKSRVCPACGLELKAFRKEEQPRCPACFETFAHEIRQFYENHGISETYSGRLPQKLEAFKRLYRKKEELTQSLELAVSNEDYEKAAQLRDRLKDLEKGSQE